MDEIGKKMQFAAEEFITQLKSYPLSCIGKPAELSEVGIFCAECNTMYGIEVPRELLFFWEVAGGCMWNGHELFGVFPLSTPDIRYTMPDIMTAQEELRFSFIPSHMLIIGRWDESLYLFDGERNLYLEVGNVIATEYNRFTSLSGIYDKILSG